MAEDGDELLFHVATGVETPFFDDVRGSRYCAPLWPAEICSPGGDCAGRQPRDHAVSKQAQNGWDHGGADRGMRRYRGHDRADQFRWENAALLGVAVQSGAMLTDSPNADSDHYKW
ncbi:hypothetical protein HPP92_013228 [Vanilla planifolia]|uniref:Uncharacterized protein n=1 Tax=Vanilla planifolia TaxID=51239 RepID=A0A835QX90_VANPL|nr:hypothetical protein HPP92_013228 [Vanilla planifolia]